MPCDYTLPDGINNSENWAKDLNGIPMSIVKTVAPIGITFGQGDNSNIYKLLLTAAGISPSISVVNVNASATDGTFVSVGKNIYWVQSGTNVAQYISKCDVCPGIQPCGPKPSSPKTTVASLAAAGYTQGPNFNCKIRVLTPSSTPQEITTKFAAIKDNALISLLNSYSFPLLAGTGKPTANEIQDAFAKFNTRVSFTYCAYEKMYKKALTAYFQTSTIENKQRAVLLNLKLHILISGLNRIRRYFQTSSHTLITANTNNNPIVATSAELEKQLSSLTTKDGDRALYSRMVEYTEEKNQAHRNLLGLYSVLNLVALGIIFYIARE